MKKLILALMLPAALATTNLALADDDDYVIDDELRRVCHKGRETKIIPAEAAIAHAMHGDSRGYCPGDEPDDRPVAGALGMLRCGSNDAGEVVVQALSLSHEPDVTLPVEMEEDINCAAALRRALNAGFKVRSTNAGGDSLVVEYLLVR